MEKLNYFCHTLAERFPWKDMEDELTEETFKNAIYAHDEFWAKLNAILEPHKEESPIRCIEIIDFVGKWENRRTKDEATLAHFKNDKVVEIILPFFLEAVKQKCNISVTQLFILLDISFEHPKLAPSVCSAMLYISPQQIVVKNEKYEKELISDYYYLYRKETPIKYILKQLGLR